MNPGLPFNAVQFLRHPGVLGRWGALWLWAVVGHLLLVVRLSADETPAQLEYKVKAGYLFNFAKFIQWPDGALATSETPFVIGVLDDADVALVIRTVLDSKNVDRHPVQVRNVTTDEAAKACHLLFVPRAAGKTPEEVCRSLGSAPVLLVGETERFAERGGLLGFVREDERIRFQLHLDRATAAGFKVSSKLSNVARLVTAAPAPKP